MVIITILISYHCLLRNISYVIFRIKLSRIKRRTWDSIDFDWKNINMHSFDVPSDIEPDYDSPSIPNNPHTYENQINNLRKREIVTNPSSRTIINLTEDGATIQCSYDNCPSDKGKTYPSNQIRSYGESDKKTIVVEVHHGNVQSNAINRNPNKTVPPLVMSNAINSETSSISSNATLSSAIIEEIQRRKMKLKSTNQPSVPPPVPAKVNGVLKTLDNEKKKQHVALMDEFKKVHKKMFSSQDLSLINPGRPIPMQEDNNKEKCEDLDRQQTLELKKTHQKIVNNNNIKTESTASAEIPPPPPPMPVIAKTVNGTLKTEDGTKTGNFIKNNVTKNGIVKRTPTPDYENSNIEALTAKLQLKKHSKEEMAELESIESYKLKNPSSPQPKPPSTYFVRSPNGTATMKKHARPVSVTIGEYPSKALKEPSKLGFINTDSKPNSLDQNDNIPIGSRLQSELAMTLSRSNLRKKTEPLDDGCR